MSNVIPFRVPQWEQKVLALMAKQRWCPYTGEPLTADCVVMIGRDREPRWLISQQGWLQMTDGMKHYLARQGTVPELSTIKESP